MKEIIVKSQAELDSIPVDFDGKIIIKFGTPYNRAVVNRRFLYSVVAMKNSSVESWGNSSVVARENSSVVAWENSSVVARGNSFVVARGNSSVEARGNSSVVARGNSSVEAWGNSSVEACWNTQVVDCTCEHNIYVRGNARIVYNPRNITEYLSHYGIPHSDGKVKLYKAVHKRDGRYFSHKRDDFEYTIGEMAIADGLTADESVDCGNGIHIAYKEWAVDFGKGWRDLAILEVEADAANIVVPLNGSGKVRTDKVLVLREVPLEECGLLGKILAKNRRAA